MPAPTASRPAVVTSGLPSTVAMPPSTLSSAASFFQASDLRTCAQAANSRSGHACQRLLRLSSDHMVTGCCKSAHPSIEVESSSSMYNA